jgi:hypothetical protein
LAFGFRLSWNVDSKGQPVRDSLHASDDRFLLPDHVGIRQRKPGRSRQRISTIFNCYPPTTRGVPSTPKRSDADHPCRNDDFVCESKNGIFHGFARGGAGNDQHRDWPGSAASRGGNVRPDVLGRWRDSGKGGGRSDGGLLKRFQGNPDVEKAKVDFDRAQEVEERFHKDFDGQDFT